MEVSICLLTPPYPHHTILLSSLHTILLTHHSTLSSTPPTARETKALVRSQLADDISAAVNSHSPPELIQLSQTALSSLKVGPSVKGVAKMTLTLTPTGRQSVNTNVVMFYVCVCHHHLYNMGAEGRGRAGQGKGEGQGSTVI